MLVLVSAGCEQARDVTGRFGPAPAYSQDAVPVSDQTTVRRVFSADHRLYGTMSADGRHLAEMHAETGELHVRNLVSGASRVVTEFNEFPYDKGVAFPGAFARSGGRLTAMVYYNDGISTLEIVDTDSRASSVLYSDTARWPWAYDWTPDDTSVLVTIGGPEEDGADLALLPVSGGPPQVLRRLRSMPERALVSPDGRYVAWDERVDESSRGREIFIAPVAGGAPVGVTRRPGESVVAGWTPDGSGLLIMTDASGAPGLWLHDVRNGRPEGRPQLIRADFWRGEPLGISPDGRFHYILHTGTFNIYEAQYDASARRLVSEPTPVLPFAEREIWSPAWSPDGRQLAYVYRSGAIDRTAVWQLAVRSMDTGEERRLSTPVTQFRTLQWTPAGDALVFFGATSGNVSGAYRLDLRSARLEQPWQLLPDLEVSEFWPGSDGSYTVAGRGIFTHVDATGQRRELHNAESNPCCGVTVRRSPDARWFAYRLMTPQGATMLHELIVISGETAGTPRTLYATTQGIPVLHFSPDSRQVIFGVRSADESAVELMSIPVEGGEAVPIGATMAGLMSLNSRGDRTITWAGGTRSSEVWVMENYLPRRQ